MSHSKNRDAMHVCILSIGSNDHQEKNIALAQRRLTERFPRIRFAPEQITEPLYLSNPARFTNQVAAIETALPADAIRHILKEIERESGRLPEDKLKEKVCLDIDLLTFDDQMLKPADLKRGDVIAGMKSIGAPSNG